MVFTAERIPLTEGEYLRLRGLALKSAEDFLRMYKSIPNKTASCLPVKTTFYGSAPRTAQELLEVCIKSPSRAYSRAYCVDKEGETWTGHPDAEWQAGGEGPSKGQGAQPQTMGEKGIGAD